MVQPSEEPIWFKSKAWRLYAAKGHEIIVDDILFPWMQRNPETPESKCQLDKSG